MGDEGREEARKKDEAYVYYIPEGEWPNHFSSLFLSADTLSTMIEAVLLSGLLLVGRTFPEETKPKGSMPLQEVAMAMVLMSIQRRLYNSYLEAVYCSFPGQRTQPVSEHKLKKEKDIVGREREQVESIVHQDRLTLVANHYLMSFGMYWMHRALHVNPWLWRNIHSIHHWAKHPLSRTTYQDHWFDNFGNAIV